jgi:hypothetical protein
MLCMSFERCQPCRRRARWRDEPTAQATCTSSGSPSTGTSAAEAVPGRLSVLLYNLEQTSLANLARATSGSAAAGQTARSTTISVFLCPSDRTIPGLAGG